MDDITIGGRSGRTLFSGFKVGGAKEGESMIMENCGAALGLDCPGACTAAGGRVTATRGDALEGEGPGDNDRCSK